MISTRSKTAFLALTLLFGAKAYSFPEMVRHGYTNCTACHISPSGGGPLTNYGRNLAKELLSYKWAPESQEAAPKEAEEKNWHLGGEARVLQFYRNNEFENRKRIIPMQIQADASYNTESYAAVGRLGVMGKSSESSSEGGDGEKESESNEITLGLQVPMVYGLARFSEVGSVRAGIFLPAYGLNNSMHFLGTRSGLGLGFDDQRPAVELAWLGERFGALATVFDSHSKYVGGSGWTVQGQFSPTDKSKIAVNYWSESNLRRLLGFWFASSIYGPVFMSGDWNWSQEPLFGVKGQYRFTKLGWELRQGLNVFLMHDFSQRDMRHVYTRIERIGPGVQFYPLPYLEVEATWLRETNRLYSTKTGDYAYVLFHAYY